MNCFLFGEHQRFCRRRAPSCGQWDKLTEKMFKHHTGLKGGSRSRRVQAQRPAESEATGQMWGPRAGRR